MSLENLMIEESLKKDQEFWIWNYLRSIAELLNNDKREYVAREFVKFISRNYKINQFDKYDFIANICFLKTNENGRITSMASGCSGIMDYKNILCSIYHDFQNQEIVFPGDVVNSNIKVKFVKWLHGKLKLKDTFLIKEGRRLIGKGQIINTLNKELLKGNYP